MNVDTSKIPGPKTRRYIDRLIALLESIMDETPYCSPSPDAPLPLTLTDADRAQIVQDGHMALLPHFVAMLEAEQDSNDEAWNAARRQFCKAYVDLLQARTEAVYLEVQQEQQTAT